MKILILANGCNFFSGGDKIFLGLASRWRDLGHQVTIVTNEKGAVFCANHRIPSSAVILWSTSRFDRWGSLFSGIYKTVVCLFKSLSSPDASAEIVFSSSDFLFDVLPALVFKLKNPKVFWVGASYLLVPRWGWGYPSGSIYGFIYYCQQRLSLFLMKRYLSLAFTSIPANRDRFYNHGSLNEETVVALRGGVDLKEIGAIVRPEPKYEGIFVGRFVPQKNLFELLEIWRLVNLSRPGSRLALVGAGPLEAKLRRRTQDLGLAGEVDFLGVLDGPAKVSAVKSAKLFALSSKFDSGNLALDEALAAGVPGIIYDLPVLDYPQGVLRVPEGEKETFAQKIIYLLSHDGERQALSEEGKKFARQLDFNLKARLTLSLFQNLIAGGY